MKRFECFLLATIMAVSIMLVQTKPAKANLAVAGYVITSVMAYTPSTGACRVQMSVSGVGINEVLETYFFYGQIIVVDLIGIHSDKSCHESEGETGVVTLSSPALTHPFDTDDMWVFKVNLGDLVTDR